MTTFATQDISLLATPPPSLLPASGRPVWPLLAGTLTGVFLAQWGSVILWVPPYQQSTVWLPGSLLLAITLLTTPRLWPAVLVAGAIGQAVLFSILGLVAPPIAVVLGVELLLVTWAVAGLWRRVVREAIGFATFREFVLYLPVVVAGGALLVSLVFIAGAYVFGYRPPSFLVWRTFALSVVLGYLMVTPTVILLVRTLKAILGNSPSKRLEATILAVLLILAASVVFGGTMQRDAFWAVFALVIPPLLLWAALRFGPLGAAGSVLLVTLISTFGASQGLGPFTGESAADNTLSLQVFMFGTGLPLIALAVILAEQRRTVSLLRDTHERLRDLNRDLVAARETEGTRIARELHDDVGQRLALVSIGLSHLRRVIGAGQTGPLGEISRLQEQTSSISRSLRELSHELHPTALEHAGLAVALQMACEEVSRVTGINVQVVADGEMGDLPGDVSLCLFRVAQEGIANAVRHAKASSIRVAVRRDDHSVSLTISDPGVGFVHSAAREKKGLGLHSLGQRLSLVEGVLTIESTPGHGTTLRAVVPLPEKTLA